MSATPYNIWQVPAYIPYIHPELTDEAIADTESRIGFPLPPSLIALLKVQNGGYIRYKSEHHPTEQIYGIGSGCFTIDKYPMRTEDWESSIDEDRMIPFDGEDNWYLCLDYSESDTMPTVAYVDVEDDYAYQVASSFEEYLGMLHLADEYNFYLPQVDHLDHLLHVIGASLFLDFVTTPPRILGYPVHKAYKQMKSREYIAIEPNWVPRGHVNQGDQDYEALKNRLPGMTSRINEIPASSYLFTVTPGLQSSLVAICEKRSIDLRPLSDFREPWPTSYAYKMS
jgi:hypothetical protein